MSLEQEGFVRPKQEDYFKAAKKWDMHALYNTGSHCLQIKDYDSAFKLLLMAAKKGHKDAMMELVTCYAEGLGVKQNFKQSEKWLRKADPNVIIDTKPDSIIRQYAKEGYEARKKETGDGE
jgi:hypothetical protein